MGLKKYWNSVYNKRGRFYLHPHQAVSKFIHQLESNKQKKVVDLGCGSGRHCITLARAGFSVCGIDYSSRALELAKKWAEYEQLKIDFLNKDFTKALPFEENSFDGIVAFDSIHYEDMDSLHNSLKEAQRILKDHSTILISVPTKLMDSPISHLIFRMDEAKFLVSEYFHIKESFLDDKSLYCMFAEKLE